MIRRNRIAFRQNQASATRRSSRDDDNAPEDRAAAQIVVLGTVWMRLVFANLPPVAVVSKPVTQPTTAKSLC